MERFIGKVGIQQRVVPVYRAGFFDHLADACDGGLSVFAGKVHADESIPRIEQLEIAHLVQRPSLHFRKIQSPAYFLWQFGLVGWLEKWNPDVLIVEANPRYLSTRRAIRWMHSRGRPVLGWGLGAPPVHSGAFPLSELVSAWQERTRRSFLLSLDALIAYSHRGAREYEALGFPKNKIFAATNVVTPRPGGLPPERPPHFDGQPKVLFVGRLQARKRIDNLIIACKNLPETIQPQLWIVGDGPQRRELETLASVIYPRTAFHGAQRGAELENWFNEADLFVLPGTGGLAVQEAMAHGLPVIVAKGDGTQDDLVRPVNGWRVPPGDEAAFASVLQEALSDPPRLRRMGKESFRIVQEEANLEEMVRAFVRALTAITFNA